MLKIKWDVVSSTTSTTTTTTVVCGFVIHVDVLLKGGKQKTSKAATAAARAC